MAELDGKTREPEVVQAVVAQIKALGDNTQANYEELRKNHEQLKSIVDKHGENMTADVKEQVIRFTEDITTRQKALDDQITKRMDSVELALQRLPIGGNADDPLVKDAHEFAISNLVLQKKEGATYQDTLGIKPNVDEYKAYLKSFNHFLRCKGDDRNLSSEHFKALSVGVDPDGGYTVTPAMSARIITKLWESDPIRQLASVETITTQALEWSVDWDEAGWGWEAETVAGAETDTPKIYKKRIPVHVMYAKPRATQTLLEDSGINIENWLADKVANRFMRGEGAAFVTGDGVGKPRGFTTYSSGTTYGTVEQVNMGAAAALVADGFIKVKYTLLEQYLNRCTWVMNRLTVADAMYLKDGTGAYIWKPGLEKDSQATLVGLPVRMSTTMPIVAANALSVALADWKEAYMIVDRLGITVQKDPYTAKPFVEFYTRKRVGGDVVNFEAIKIGKVAV